MMIGNAHAVTIAPEELHDFSTGKMFHFKCVIIMIVCGHMIRMVSHLCPCCNVGNGMFIEPHQPIAHPHDCLLIIVPAPSIGAELKVIVHKLVDGVVTSEVSDVYH